MSEWKQRWRRAPRWTRIIGMVAVGLISAVVFGFVFGIAVKALWNWLMPELFGLKAITYWQAFGLVILARLLVGFSGGDHREKQGPPRRGMRREHCSGEEGPGRHWQQYDQWWREEGRAAFEAYTEKKGEESPQGSREE